MKYLITVNPQLQQFEAVVNRIAHTGMPDGVHELARGRNVVAVFDTPSGDPLNIKSFKRPGIVNAVIYTSLRDSKARRSYEYAEQLIALGFDTPEPVAYIECRDGASLRDSYYISRQIDADEFRYVERRPDADRLLTALGHELARLHRAGVWMRDFSPGNILFRPDPKAPHGYRFYYVDLNRSTFGVTDRRQLMSMFRAIVVYPEQVEAIARAYAQATASDAETTVAEALRQHSRFQNYLHRKRTLKRIIMPWKQKYR